MGTDQKADAVVMTEAGGSRQGASARGRGSARSLGTPSQFPGCQPSQASPAEARRRGLFI